jgi:hypothetical protein
MTPHWNAGLGKQPVDLARHRRLEVAAQRRIDDRAPQPVNHEIGPEEGDHATCSTEEREEARLAVTGQAQEGWACPLQQTLDLGIGDLHRLGLEPQMAGRCREPAPDCLIVMP